MTNDLTSNTQAAIYVVVSDDFAQVSGGGIKTGFSGDMINRLAAYKAVLDDA